jgi:Tfp pilus assembly protein PilV
MRNRLGFTFIETIVYLAIVSVVLVSIIGFSQRIISARNKSRTIEEVQQNVRFAWERMSQDVRNSSSVASDSTLASNLVSGGFLHLAQDTVDVYYEITNNQLTRNDVALTSDQLEVENFTVTSISDSSYKIDLQIKYKNPNNWVDYDWDVDLTTTLNLRNAN